MLHQDIKSGPLTVADRAALTDEERGFLVGFAAMDEDTRDMFLTAFGLAVRAETDEEAQLHLLGFKAWMTERRAAK